MRRPRRSFLALAVAVILAGGCARPQARVEPIDTISIDELAAQLADSAAAPPALLHIGFAPLYRSGHIPGSQYVGAGNTAEGIAGLEQALAALPADRPVVLYCGCCPWQDCPNVQPAFQAVRRTGRTGVRVLYVTGNLQRDWIDRGLPAEKGGDEGRAQ
jgi:hypothetical protein